MRFPDRRYYGRIAASTGFRPEPLERVFRLVTLLQTIKEDLGDELSLRGGTALNLLHLDVPRLSVDIDLDFIGTADADEAKRRRPSLLETIERIAQASGYKVIPERPSYAMAHLRMHYEDIEGRPCVHQSRREFSGSRSGHGARASCGRASVSGRCPSL